MSKDAYYFPHDANARQDPKILAMTSVYQAEGYGWYWILVELMREQSDYKLTLKGKYAYNAYSSAMMTTPEKAKDFIEDCIHEFGLFLSDNDYFWSKSLLKRMVLKDEKSKRAKESAKNRWKKGSDKQIPSNEEQTKIHKDIDNANAYDSQSKNDANAYDLHNKIDANAYENHAKKEKESKEEKRKEKESKPNQRKTLFNPDVQRIVRFWDDNGFGFNNTYGKNQILDWLDTPQFHEAGDMIIYALEIACTNNVRKQRYVEGILEKWLEEGCKTLTDAQNQQKEFKEQFKKQQTTNGIDWDAVENEFK